MPPSKTLVDHIKENHHRFHFFFVLIISTAISFGVLYVTLVENLNIVRAQVDLIFYVSPSGNDANSCTQAQNINTPRRTINAGAACLGTGTTLYVRGGTYNETLEGNIPSGSTISAYNNETVWMNGSGNFIIYFSRQSNIVIDGINMDASNVVYDAVKFSYDSTYNTLRNLEIRTSNPGELKQGILVADQSDHNTFSNLSIHGFGTTTRDHGIYLDTSYNIIENSDFYDNSGYGVHLYDGYSGTRSSHNIVRNNVFYRNDNGGIIVSSGTNNAVYNNILYDNNDGLVVEYGGLNSWVHHNTIYNNRGVGAFLSSACDVACGATGEFHNNIVYNNATNLFNDGSMSLSNNLVGTNPQFVNIGSNDIHLTSGSPAINTGRVLTSRTVNGINITFNSDFEGTSRPQGTLPDIGADEFGGGVVTTPTPTPVVLVNNSQFISQSVPSLTMTPGSTQSVSVTMRNTGTTTWTTFDSYRLGSQNPHDNNNWGILRANLPSNVSPGSNVTFNFIITAPSIPGAYNFQWRMLREGVEWFGGLTQNIVINVQSSATPTPAPTPVSGGNMLIFDDFEYIVSRNNPAECSNFMANGWATVRANNCALNPEPNRYYGNGNIFTTNSISNYSSQFPSGGSRVLAMEALPVTYQGQTDFYLQYGDGGGAIGQIPPNHWVQFWIYSENTAEHPSLFTPQSKFLYYNRSTYYPATLGNEGYVFLVGLQHRSSAPSFTDPCPEEFTCDRGFFNTNWESGAEPGLVHGNVNNHIVDSESDLGANMGTVPHVTPNGWTLVKMHFDLTGTDPRALPGQAVYEQWIRRPGDSAWTKTTEHFGGVTQINGQTLDFYPRYRDGFRMVRIPTTVGSSTYPTDPRDNTRNYWIYLDDFAMATSEPDLPQYGFQGPIVTPTPIVTQPCTITSASWQQAQYTVGNTATMNVTVSNPANCSTNSIVLNIYDEDPFSFDDLLAGPISQQFNPTTNQTTLTYTFTAQDYIDGGNESGNESIYFTAQVQGQSNYTRSSQVNFYNSTTPPSTTPTPITGTGRTLYVSTTGNDSVTYAQNSATNPWRTIGRAAWGSTNRSAPNANEAARAGDAVMISSGVYATTGTNSRFGVAYNPVNNGISGNLITFQCDTNRGCILQLSSGSGPIIGCAGRNYIKWQGFYIDEANAQPQADTGSVVFNASNYCELHNTEINGIAVNYSDNHTGVRIEGANNTLVRNNIIYEIGDQDGGNPSYGQNSAAVMLYDSNDSIIENNTLHTTGVGIFVKGQHPGQTQRRTITRYNLIYNTRVAGLDLLADYGGRHYQNIIRDFSGAGIKFYELGSGEGAEPTNMSVVNNTIDGGEMGVLVGFGSGNEFKNNIVTNNSIAGLVSLGLVSTSENGIAFDRNLYYGNANMASFNIDGSRQNYSLALWQNTYNQDASSIGSDPLFVNLANNDFHLSAGSPARLLGRVVQNIGGTNGSVIPAGAYITGNEIIGVGGSGGPLPSITPTPTPPVPQPCTITSASWQQAQYTVGDTAVMNVIVSNPANCNTNSLVINIYDEDPFNPDDLIAGPISQQFNQTTNQTTLTYIFNAQDYIDGGNESGNESIYFTAQVQGQSTYVQSSQVNFYNSTTTVPTPTPTPSITIPTPTPGITPTPSPGISLSPTPEVGATALFEDFDPTNIPRIISRLACYTVQFAMIAFGITIVIAGIMYAFSHGNPSAMQSAKKTFLYAVVGGLIIYGVYTIIMSVGAFLGATDLSFITLSCS